MPTGVLLAAERAVTMAGTIQPTPSLVLDVGCGYGKYGVLLREYLEPTPVVHGVEAWQPYVEQHKLRGIYDHLYVGDALDLSPSVVNVYGLVMMGDVIEHMPKDKALNFLTMCKGWVVIATPVHFFETHGDLPPTEAHVSHWSREDFESTNRLDHYEESYGCIIVRLHQTIP